MRQLIFTGLFIFFTCYTIAQTADTARVYTLADTVVANRLFKESKDNLAKGKYKEASVKIDSAYNILKILFGEESKEAIEIYHLKGYSKVYLGLYDEAIDIYNKSLEVRLKIFGEKNLATAISYGDMGVAFGRKGQFEAALFFHNKAASIRSEILGADHLEVARVFANMANCYTYLSLYDKALEYYDKAGSIISKNLGEQHPDAGTIYYSRASCYNFMKEYNKGVLYAKKALEIWLNSFGSQHPYVSSAYDLLGILLNAKGDHDLAREIFKKSMDIRLKTVGELHPDVGYSYFNIASCHLKKRETAEAIIFYEKSLNVRFKSLGELHPLTAFTYNNLGVTFMTDRNFEKALEYHQKALDIRIKLFPEDHIDVSLSYFNIGSCYKELKKIDSALYYLDKALNVKSNTSIGNHLGEIFGIMAVVAGEAKSWMKADSLAQKSFNLFKYDTKNNFNLVSVLSPLSLVLKEYSKIKLNHYHLTHSRPPLDTAHSYAQQAVAALEYQQKSISSEGSKAQLADNHYAVYEGAIETSLLVADLDNSDSLRHAAFDYSERSKAALLRAKMKENEALGYAGIPDSLLQQEYDLRIDISWRERQRQEKINAGQSETDSTILALSGKIFDLRQRYDTLKTRFEREYPDYYRAKYDLRTLSLHEVQQTLLEPEQTLLEYFVGDSAVYAFVVNRGDYQVLKIKKDFHLDSLVRVLRESIVSPHDRPLSDSLRNAAPVAYAQSAALLYEKLVAPAKPYLKSRVVIVPDGVLGYLPFEALLTKRPEKAYRFKDHAYLLHEHLISYCYSATLLRDMRDLRQRKDKQQVPAGAWLGMAPYFTGDTTLLADLFAYADDVRKDLRPLPFAGKEVANIAKLMQGKALYGKDASKKAFEQLAPQYRVLHLSTHGQANDRSGDYSFLAFGELKDSTGNDLLYVHDLYNYALNADLITLSACETGIGQLLRGEGIVSLARAFSYAGAKSIATSLWQVSDAKTQELMVDFYKGLIKNNNKDDEKKPPKDTALCQAKRKMAKTRDKSDPYYWAGFILIGDSGGLSEN